MGIVKTLAIICGLTGVLCIATVTGVCHDATDIQREAFLHTVHIVTNDTQRDAMDVFAVQSLMDAVSETIGCHMGDPCRCLEAGSANPITASSYESLSLLLLRYIYDRGATCVALSNLGNEAATLEFSHGWASSRDLVHVFTKTFGNLVKAHHDDDHDDDDDSHGDDHHDRKKRSGDDDDNGDEDDDEHHDSSDEHDSHEHSTHYHLHGNCPHVTCFDANVMVHMLHDLDIEGQQVSMATIAALVIEGIVTDTPFAIDCDDDHDDYMDLPDESEFFKDIFARLGTRHPNSLTYEEFQILHEKLGLSGEADSHEGDSHGGDSHEGHNHRRRKRNIQYNITQCYSVAELFQAYSFPTDLDLSTTQFSTICPSLLQQIVSRECEVKPEEDHPHDEVTTAEKYGYGSLCVFIICIAALPGMFLYPITAKRDLKYRLVMSYMVGLAIGSLFADSLLHLLPAALGLHVHDDEGHDHHEGEAVFEDHTAKNLVAIGAAILFFLLESVMNYIVRGRVDERGIAHTIANKYSTPDNVDVEKPKDGDEQLSFFLRIKSVAWMIVFGDALHNFVDGLAIGAAFSQSIAGGISTSLAILCHEIPHELGDFAVLVNSGMTVGQAAIFNFVSALTCFAGLYVGIPISVSDTARNWIFIIAAGLFLYIALSDMVPEGHELQIGEKGLLTILLQLLGILTGVAILLVIAIYEEALLHAL